MMRTGVCTGTPRAQATSCGAVRSDMVLAVRMISPPIGSSRVRPADPLELDQVLGGARPVELPVGQPCDHGPAGELAERRVNLRQADVVRWASALRRGSRQPGSRCTSAAAIRSASIPLAAHWAGTSASIRLLASSLFCDGSPPSR